MDTYIEAGIDWLGVSYPETYDETLTQNEIIKRNKQWQNPIESKF